MPEEAGENINLLPQESQKNISGVGNDKLLSEVFDGNEKLTIKENEIRVSKDQSVQCGAGASDTEAKLKQAETELGVSRNQNEQLKEDVSNMKEKIEETEGELKKLSDTKNELENKVEKSEREYQLLKEVTEKQNITFSQEQEEKATEISVLKNKLSETNQDLKTIQSENENLRIDCYNVSQAGQEPIKSMVVLAGPGEDKSGLCDLFSGTENNFNANQEKTVGKLVNWRGDGDPFLIIDTPVFEPEEDVAETTKIMMNELKKYKNMYVFVIALNGTNPRIDQNRKQMIRELKKMFGQTFLDKNTVFAITNWHYDQGSIEKREKSGKKEINWNEKLQKELNLSNVKLAFLDASYGEERIEKAKIEEQLHKMKHWLFTIPAYPCTHLKQM